MSWFYGTVILLSFLGAIVGWLRGGREGMSLGIVAGVFLALWVAIAKISKLIYPVEYVYESEAPSFERTTSSGSVTVVVNIPKLPQRSIHGLSLDEWRILSKEVSRTGNFTQPILEEAFGSQKEGRRIHGLVAGPLAECGALVKYGNGYNVTDHVGRHLFSQLAKGDYEVMKLVDNDNAGYSPLPEL
jgi:hypothetical protein